MKVILYLNNVYYHTTETPDWMPVIYWMVSSIGGGNRYRRQNQFDSIDSHIIEFRHCGLGNYHCHVPTEEEEQIKAVKIHSKKT